MQMTRLVELLLLGIVDVKRVGASSLELVFSNDRTLLQEGDNSDQFENYFIQQHGQPAIYV
jgi:hypothetical protein